MKKLLFFPLVILVIACNNSKKDPATTTDSNTTTTTQENNSSTNKVNTTPAGSPSISYTVDGATVTHSASALVTKEKDNLQPGAPYICVLTSNNAANNNESLTFNFVFDTKPGTYPVVGSSLIRGQDPNNQMFGGILGGKPEITEYKVNLTECRDLGSNNMGGHRWSISGTCDEVRIKAMKLMLMDKTKNHPEEITVQKISFSNLTFEDNADEIMKRALEGMKKNN